MASIESNESEAAPKPSGWPMRIGLLLALIGGGAGFYAVYAGLLFDPAEKPTETPTTELAAPTTMFVALDPMTISLGPMSTNRHLRFTAHLEVEKFHLEEVERIRPRIMDVLNTYLRAIETNDFAETSTMIRIRAQLLRRLQIVAGEGRIRDLLIVEFVLN